MVHKTERGVLNPHGPTRLGATLRALETVRLMPCEREILYCVLGLTEREREACDNCASCSS
jgi:hypothetical protein